MQEYNIVSTGKTTIARILGRLLHMLEILPKDKVTEVQRTDLVGEYIGHTGPKTSKKIEEAEGGIVFEDEAYRLMLPQPRETYKDFGLEALEEIMSVMDSGKIAVIFAGYTEPMERVISSNEGFKRRITNVNAIKKLIERETTKKQRNEVNGGLVDPMLVNAKENVDLRLEVDNVILDDVLTIALEDLKRDATQNNIVDRMIWDVMMHRAPGLQGSWEECWCTKSPHMAFLGNPGTGKRLT
ncbi:hypothetical protein IFM89_023026 [Coptis chinensis]|uniref:ATPase AAA-type core domain-containing protein n=1 Tax=Coptis chinensis TaxID=261450 RepID=A0A835ICB1_9MAGN|nr:hypothetical protein IFM89_023026 [Coptis chinensis]